MSKHSDDIKPPLASLLVLGLSSAVIVAFISYAVAWLGDLEPQDAKIVSAVGPTLGIFIGVAVAGIWWRFSASIITRFFQVPWESLAVRLAPVRRCLDFIAGSILLQLGSAALCFFLSARLGFSFFGVFWGSLTWFLLGRAGYLMRIKWWPKPNRATDPVPAPDVEVFDGTDKPFGPRVETITQRFSDFVIPEIRSAQTDKAFKDAGRLLLKISQADTEQRATELAAEARGYVNALCEQQLIDGEQERLFLATIVELRQNWTRPLRGQGGDYE